MEVEEEEAENHKSVSNHQYTLIRKVIVSAKVKYGAEKYTWDTDQVGNAANALGDAQCGKNISRKAKLLLRRTSSN